jgi:hypothetical protein
MAVEAVVIKDVEDTFGNYALKNFAGLEKPAMIDYWQLTPGAMLLLLLLMITMALVCWRRYQRWQRNAYRREALALLDATADGGERLRLLPKLLKAVALRSYPRQSVAALTGNDWLAFLDASTSEPGKVFQTDVGRQLLGLSYHAELAVTAEQAKVLECRVREWITGHKSDA